MRVIVADDVALLRTAVARALQHASFDVVAEVEDAKSLLDAVTRERPDAVVVDIRLPPTHTDEGIRAALQIRRDHPAVGVLVLSQYAVTDYAVRLLDGGGQGIGYLLKGRVASVDVLADALRRVAAGDSVVDPEIVARLVGRQREHDPLNALTDREREVLGLMAEGRSNQAIATRLFLGAKTVETHVRSIFNKLGLEPATDDHRRVLAVLTFLRHA